MPKVDEMLKSPTSGHIRDSLYSVGKFMVQLPDKNEAANKTFTPADSKKFKKLEGNLRIGDSVMSDLNGIFRLAVKERESAKVLKALKILELNGLLTYHVDMFGNPAYPTVENATFLKMQEIVKELDKELKK